MSDVKLSHAGSLRSGNYILHEGTVLQVKDTQTSRPGKHGHAKVRIKCINIFTGNGKEVVMPGHDSVEVPIIYKKNAQVLSIVGETLELMDMESFETVTTESKFIDEEISGKVEAGQTVLIWYVTDKILIKSIVEEA